MTGRNEPCRCGSGKKYKKCCLEKDSHLTLITGGRNNKVKPDELSEEEAEAAKTLELYQEVFFTKDLTQFYLEKIEGRARGTRLKYSSSIRLIGKALLGFETSAWNELKPDFWEEILLFDFLEISEEPSYNQAENLFSVLVQFARWMDKKYGWENDDFVKFIIDKNKYAIMDAIYIFNGIHFGRFPRPLQGLANYDLREEKGVSGLFLVEDMTKKLIKTQDLIRGKKHTIKLPKEVMENDAVHYGMVFHGTVKTREGEKNKEFYDIECVYPPRALPYIKKNFGV